MYKSSPEFASTKPLNLRGHGEVALMVGGMKMSTNVVCVNHNLTSYNFTYMHVRVCSLL